MAGTNWHVRIAEARKRGRFIAKDRAAARGWLSCACGELDPRIPRYGSGVPQDLVLWDLGSKFYGVVRANDFDRAAMFLQKIEAREAELLAELGEGK